MFKVDMHIHSIFGGDSAIRPDEVVPCAKRAGLDGICITEHHDFELSQAFEAIARKTGFPVFRGMEYRADEGHLLIFGVPVGRSDLLPGLPIQHAIDWVVGLGGVAIPAHPYQASLSGRCLGSKVFELKNIIALETLNASVSLEENQLAQTAADQLKLAGIGGSDAHGPIAIGRAYTLFPDSLHSIKQLVQALKNGRYEAVKNKIYRPLG